MAFTALESLHSAALPPSSTSWKNWWANCVRWFCGAMVTPRNFVLSLYLHCLLISTEILHYNGIITRSTMARGRWTVSEAQSSESPTAWSNPGSSISALLRICRRSIYRCFLNKSLYLSQEDKIIKPSFVKNAPAIKGTLDEHHIKRDCNLGNVCFLEFYYLSDDKEPFHTQYYSRLNTLVGDHEREIDKWTKTYVVIAKRFTMEIVKLDCSVMPVVSGFMHHALRRKVHLWFFQYQTVLPTTKVNFISFT